ncbi:MAG: exodeoxyribonuclease III [Dysgonamonadaceae bacterium]|jgi:exodeoxyribonuclease-3|nr:exodeoxyribonuclease III [Dysgonamonadaceae bacterium]
MKIISFNLNGIRSAAGKGLFGWLGREAPDVFCVQETKAQPEQMDSVTLRSLGYEHQMIHSAVKKGYSGVAIFSRLKPDHYVIGMGIREYDIEGRVIRADFGDLTVVCVYVPSGTTGDIRQAVKMRFLESFTQYLIDLSRTRRDVVICGDYNICRTPADINHPERHVNVSGFLLEERVWFERFLSLGFTDSFREFNGDLGQYSWWSFRAGSREKNLGWRIDYHIVSESLKPALKSAAILRDAVFSDHAPVMVEIRN